MERRDGSVLDINAICADLGQKCLQLLCLHVLSGCDTTSYPYSKGNVTALNAMVSGIYQCDIDTTHTELMNAAMPSFVSLNIFYCQIFIKQWGWVTSSHSLSYDPYPTI